MHSRPNRYVSWMFGGLFWLWVLTVLVIAVWPVPYKYPWIISALAAAVLLCVVTAKRWMQQSENFFFAALLILLIDVSWTMLCFEWPLLVIVGGLMAGVMLFATARVRARAEDD